MNDDTRTLEASEEIVNSIDGYFSITSDDNGYFLAVYPPKGDGQPVKMPQITAQLESYNDVGKIENALLVRIVKDALGTPVKVADKLTEVDPDIQISISRDRMEATLQIDMPKGCRPVSLDEVMEKIKAAGIVYGIDLEAIETAAARAGTSVVCAKGLAPVNGVNASITYLVDLENKGRPVELDDGRVDYKNLNMFTVVQKDNLLAEKIPPTPGSVGIDVFGNEVPAKPGKDIIVPAGKNVYVIEGLKLYAAQAGQLVVSNKKLNIIPIIEVKGDVDLSTGNIEFMGSVLVKGSVQTGFIVKAQGDVEIAGNVCGGTVEGKNITIRMGIQGMNKGYIMATESVNAKYIENATVSAAKDVIVSDVILHSKISAGKKVVVEERRGLIVGGQVSAGEEIRAKILGAPSATSTDIEVGVNPALREEYQISRKEIRKLEFDLEQAQKALNILRAMNQSTMPPDKREMLLKLTKAQFHLMGQTETLRNRLTEIEIALEEMRYGHIKVADTVHPGVKLVVGTLVKPIRDEIKFANFYAEDGEIKTGSYR